MDKYAKGEGEKTKMIYQKKLSKKFLVATVAGAFVTTTVLPGVSAAEGFSDVLPGNTHAENISKAVEMGLIKGVNGMFNPNNSITRGQVVKVLARQLEKKHGKQDYSAIKPFSDVPANIKDKELYEATLTVIYHKAFLGDNNNLKPSQNITREQMASVLVRAFGLELVGENLEIIDLNKVNSHHAESVQILANLGITKPANGQFYPKKDVTRAQFTSFFVRALDGNQESTPAVEGLKIVNISSLNSSAQFLQIDFSEAITSLSPSDINIKNAKSGSSYGVKEVQLNKGGKGAQIELFKGADNADVLTRLTDYSVTLNIGSELLAHSFYRPGYVESYVTEIDVNNRKFTVRHGNGSTRVIEVPSAITKLDFQEILGEEIRVWFDGKNKLLDFQAGEPTAKYDAIAISGVDEIKLLKEDKVYDLSDNFFQNQSKTSQFSFYLNGEKIEWGDYTKMRPGDRFTYAKIGFDDSGDILFVSAYNLNQFLIVDKIANHEVVGYLGEGTGGSFNAKRATIVKDGKVIGHSDLKQGDVVFFNRDANDGDGFAEVVSLGFVYPGTIEKVYHNKVGMLGRTFSYSEHFELENYKVDYGTAVYLNKYGETEYIDADIAEELQAAGNVMIYMNRVGNIVYIAGSTVDVERNTVTSMLTSSIYGGKEFSKDSIEVEALFSTGEQKLFKANLKELKSIIVDGTTYDIDNDAKNTKWTATLENDNKAILLTNNSTGKKIKVTIANTKGELIKLHLNKNRSKIEKIEFYENRSSISKSTVGHDNAYIEGKKLNNKTIVFDAKKFESNAKDVKVSTWGDYKGADITDAKIIYDKYDEVLALVINSTTSNSDVFEEALITNILRNTNREIVEITAFISGEKRTIAVNEITAPNVEIGAFAMLVLDDKNGNLVEGIITTDEFASNSKIGVGYAFKDKISPDAVNVGKREVIIGEETYKLASDGLVIDARNKNDIKVKSLTDLRGKDVIVIKDEKDSSFIKFFVYGGVGNLPEIKEEKEVKEVKEVAALIGALSETVEVEEADQVSKAKAAFDRLSSKQVMSLPEQTKEKLMKAMADLEALAVTEFVITSVHESYADLDEELLGIATITVKGTIASADKGKVSEVKISILPLGEDQKVDTVSVDVNGEFLFEGIASKTQTIVKVEYTVNGVTQLKEINLKGSAADQKGPKSSNS